MAVPPELTILNLTGLFNLNRSLSDNDKMDEILRLQGIGWLPRQASRMAGISIMFRLLNEDGVESVDLHQILTGGLGVPSNAERRTLTWKDEEFENSLFGCVITKSRRVKVDELDDSFLKEGWAPDALEHGLIQVFAVSDTKKSGTTWTADQVLGIGEVDGVRRYVRSISFTGTEDEKIQARMIYDYAGPLNEPLS